MKETVEKLKINSPPLDKTTVTTTNNNNITKGKAH